MKKYLSRILFTCGILFPLLHIANDLIAAITYPGYNIANQTMSELSAIGAPTRNLQLAFFKVEEILIILFGVGIFIFSNSKRSLKFVGALVVVLGVLLIVEMLFPQSSMQLSGGVADQIIHSIVIGGNVVLILLIISLGAFALGKIFRLYSIATILTMMIGGAMAAILASKATGFSAPGMGVLERFSYYSYLLWFLVLATYLLRRKTVEDS